MGVPTTGRKDRTVAIDPREKPDSKDKKGNDQNSAFTMQYAAHKSCTYVPELIEKDNSVLCIERNCQKKVCINPILSC